MVPLDFVLIALMRERGFTTESLGPVGLFLFLEATVVAVLCRTAETGLPSAAHPRHLGTSITLPNYTLVIFAAAAAFLLIRFLLIRKPVESALLWTLSAFFLSLHFATNSRLATLYAATAACILFASVVESSYLLAYHDELTTLPSRRAFNDAMHRLQVPYSIAVVDIDHFKKFNDTYGHETGDQVLRLVASNLARVTGGGRAYRCGGEEPISSFRGKIRPTCWIISSGCARTSRLRNFACAATIAAWRHAVQTGARIALVAAPPRDKPFAIWPRPLPSHPHRLRSR